MRAFRAIALLLPLALAGCASDASLDGYSLASGAEPASAAAAPGAGTSEPAPRAGARYVLSADEKGLDCRRLTGRMKIRIVQMKSLADLPRSSELSRSMHAAHGEIAGGIGASSTGADPAADDARSRAMLEAYNRELAAKGCKTLDLAAELQR
jgi:hypothetical protein